MTNIIEVENKIITLRDQQVILDSDVAELYGVQTKEINQAVRNNPEKFPQGYIFQLENQEFKDLRSKFLTTKYQKTRQLPKAFTEKGLYMLATILKSTEGAVESYHTGSAARGELRGAEDVAAARRPVGGGSSDGRVTGPEQRDLL